MCHCWYERWRKRPVRGHGIRRGKPGGADKRHRSGHRRDRSRDQRGDRQSFHQKRQIQQAHGGGDLQPGPHRAGPR